jgi:DNA-directed RNA polymerase specialized sigma24 family protein
VRVVKRQEAEELLNEVFLSVWQNAHRYEGRSEPLTWVHRSPNKAMSALRKKTEVRVSR